MFAPAGLSRQVHTVACNARPSDSLCEPQAHFFVVVVPKAELRFTDETLKDDQVVVVESDAPELVSIFGKESISSAWVTLVNGI
jgi:hypothetical protein